MSDNIYNYTKIDTGLVYPEYVSINLEENDSISITVRHIQPKGFPTIRGQTSHIELSEEEFEKLLKAGQNYICKKLGML